MKQRNRIETVLVFIAKIKPIGWLLKLLLLPFTRSRLIPLGFCFYLPALGDCAIALPEGDNFIMVNEGRDGVANALYWRGINGVSPGFINMWLAASKDANVILDIGGGTGTVSLMSSAINKSAKIYTFEPVKDKYEYLLRNVKANNFTNITLIKKAVSNKQEPITLFVPHYPYVFTSASMMQNFRPKEDVNKEIQVDCICIDNFLNEQKIENVDLITLNIEGAEPYALDGMQKTIEINSPIIMLEILPNSEAGAMIVEFFSKYDYVWYWLSNSGPIRTDSQVINQSLEEGMYLLSPTSKNVESMYTHSLSSVKNV